MMQYCAYCRGVTSTGGFMHEWGCPANRWNRTYVSGTWSPLPPLSAFKKCPTCGLEWRGAEECPTCNLKPWARGRKVQETLELAYEKLYGHREWNGAGDLATLIAGVAVNCSEAHHKQYQERQKAIEERDQARDGCRKLVALVRAKADADDFVWHLCTDHLCRGLVCMAYAALPPELRAAIEEAK